MSSANFKLKRTAAASCGFLATARFSCFDNVMVVINICISEPAFNYIVKVLNDVLINVIVME